MMHHPRGELSDPQLKEIGSMDELRKRLEADDEDSLREIR